MVAITVILAAVIASFVLGLGDQAQQTTPQVSVSFDYDGSQDGSSTSNTDFSSGNALNDEGTNSNNGILSLTHDGGDSVNENRLSIVDGEGNDISTLDNAGHIGDGDDISAGTTIDVGIDYDDTIRVVYTGESGDSSSTLATFEAPEA